MNQINHKDGDRLNNDVENLEYCTSQGNNLHAYKTGRHKPNGKRKLTPTDYIEIRRLYKSGGWTHEKLAVKYNVTATHIGYVIHRSPSAIREKMGKR